MRRFAPISPENSSIVLQIASVDPSFCRNLLTLIREIRIISETGTFRLSRMLSECSQYEMGKIAQNGEQEIIQ